MKLTLALLLAASPAFAATQDGLHDLTPGQYELKVSGLLCWACARAVAIELGAAPGVESAKADFDRQAIMVTVKTGAVVTPSQIKKALKRAERLANLGGRYQVASLAYQVAPISPPASPEAKNKARR